MKIICVVLVLFVLYGALEAARQPALSSGIPASQESINVYNQIKTQRRHRFAIFKIQNEREIGLEYTGARSENYNSFLNKLQAGGRDKCKYGVYDFEYQCNRSNRDKLVFVMLCPSSAPTREKFLYASSFNTLKNSMPGAYVSIEVDSVADASESEIRSRVSPSGRC